MFETRKFALEDGTEVILAQMSVADTRRLSAARANPTADETTLIDSWVACLEACRKRAGSPEVLWLEGCTLPGILHLLGALVDFSSPARDSAKTTSP